MSESARLMKNLRQIKLKEGATDKFISRCDNFYACEKIDESEWQELVFGVTTEYDNSEEA